MKLNHLLVLILVFAIISCDSSRIYEENVDFYDKMWLADSTQHFSFSLSKTQPVNIYFNVRNTNTYPYHNLYIKYSLTDSTGQEIKSELINKNLFHEKTGKPFGSGIGDIFSHQFLLIEGLELDSMQYRIKLTQFMRQDTLEGVVSAGVRVENASKN